MITRENAGSASSEDHVIRDTISELIELVPAVPKLERLAGLLRKNAYRAEEEDGSDEDEDTQQRPVSTVCPVTFHA